MGLRNPCVVGPETQALLDTCFLSSSPSALPPERDRTIKRRRSLHLAALQIEAMQAVALRAVRGLFSLLYAVQRIRFSLLRRAGRSALACNIWHSWSQRPRLWMKPVVGAIPRRLLRLWRGDR